MKKDYRVTNCLEYLEISAERLPDKIAYTDDREQVTYAQLMENAMRIGSGLKKYNLKKQPVALLMDAHHIEQIEATLGVLYTGCFYVPLDPAAPADRLEAIFESARPALIICDKQGESARAELADKYPFEKFEDLLHAEIDMEYLEQKRKEANAYDLQVIFYTSGSTGTPKGVTHTHKDMIEYAELNVVRYNFTEETVFGAQCSFAYANSVQDVWPSILLGATVYMLSASLLSFPKKFVQELYDHKVSTIIMTPSSFNAVADAGALTAGCLPDMVCLMPAGEKINNRAMKKWEEACCNGGHFWTFYGSTELLPVSLDHYSRDYNDDEFLSAGVPYKCCHCLIVDEDMNEVEYGQTGQLLVNNPWMFHGYLNDKARTEAAFVNDPLNRGYDEKFFKTGDLAYFNEYDELVVIGRMDNMIKHNGYRMELGEVEVAAKSSEAVKEVCCLFDEDNGTIHLFYTGEIEVADLKNVLKNKLPKYALPDGVIKLEEMPYTYNIKIDRVALLQMVKKPNVKFYG